MGQQNGGRRGIGTVGQPWRWRSGRIHRPILVEIRRRGEHPLSVKLDNVQNPDVTFEDKPQKATSATDGRYPSITYTEPSKCK
jgi:hypothetical protein